MGVTNRGEASALLRAYAVTGAASLRQEAVYALPRESLAELGKSPVSSRWKSPLFTGSQIHTETDFAEFCASLGCIGIRGAKPVRFALLMHQPPILTPGHFEAMKWPKTAALSWQAAATQPPNRASA